MPPSSILHAVTVSKITQVNESIRIIRLEITNVHSSIAFVPGQWLDVYFEGHIRAGGYTILSTPSAAAAATLGNIWPPYQPYVELAIQNAPTQQVQRLQVDVPSVAGTELERVQRSVVWPPISLNLKAIRSAELAVQNAPTQQVQRLRAEDVLLVAGTELMVRVEGSFVWPPTSLNLKAIRSVVFLAGGVGVIPLICMSSYMHETGQMPQEVHFLYTSRVKGYYNVSNVLALERLLKISNARRGQFHLHLFFSGYPSRALMEEAVPRRRFEPRRVLDSDVLGVFSNIELKASTLCYVCGPPQMTDHFVELVRGQVSFETNQVLYEKWE